MSLLRDMLGAIAERGRAIADLSTISQAASPLDQIIALCERLLSSRGEATGLATAAEILDRYQELDPSSHAGFQRALLERFGPDMNRLIEASRAFLDEPGPAGAELLHRVSEPRRQQLFRLLNQAADGMHHLISMRSDLLAALPDAP